MAQETENRDSHHIVENVKKTADKIEQSFEENADKASENLDQFSKEVTGKADDFFDKIQDKVEDVIGDVKEALNLDSDPSAVDEQTEKKATQLDDLLKNVRDLKKE